MSERVSVAADLVAQLAIALGVSAQGRVLEIAVDEHWFVACNGTDAPQKVHACDVPRFHFYVEFNGWPAGLFSPYGGTIAAGAAANEDTFCDALRSAIRATHNTSSVGPGEKEKG